MDTLPHILIPAHAGTNYGVFTMSMPSFPPDGADMTRDEALTMIIASIAMEELALSHILNAEGEKLQYILGTLPGQSPCACPQDVLAVNKSVTALVEAVTQNQMLLKNKLDRVLEVCPPPACQPGPGPAPCPPPCPPGPCEASCFSQCPASCPLSRPASCQVRSCKKSALQLVGQRENILWNPNCRLVWNQRSRSGDAICWDERAPAQIQLNPGKRYTVQYTLNVSATSPIEGKIVIRQSPGGAFMDILPLYFSIEHPVHGQKTLHYACVLHPCINNRCSVTLSLMLDAAAPLCVERAVMDVIEN